jgi:SIR2-like domain
MVERTHREGARLQRTIEPPGETASRTSRHLKTVFRADAEERNEGAKIPTAAHKAVAWLVAEGFVRVVITTNFDRLLEQAFEATGVSPTIISTVDQVRGALPLTHAGPMIIKVNGDYLDIRIRNTQAELTRYDRPMIKLLDRIFDEYGLVVCGWSADWDIALRDCMIRAASRRFTTFFAVRGMASDATKRLIAARGAELIRIHDADSFFGAVQEKVRALQDANAPHPLSTSIAIATAKRYLAEPTAKIALHDLVRREVERVHDAQLGDSFPLDVDLTAEHVLSQTRRYKALASTLLALVVTGCYWGDDTHTYLWVHTVERIGNVPTAPGYEWAVKLRRYPALILLYGGGIAAMAGKKYSTVAALLKRPIERKDSAETPLLLSIQPFRIMQNNVGHLLPGMDKRYTPLSDHLYSYLRDCLRPFLADDAAYDGMFDEFEYLMALVAMDVSIQVSGHKRASYGRFAWKGRNFPGARKLSKLEKAVEDAGSQWPPLIAGLFGGDIVRLTTAKVALRELIDSFTWF